MDTIEVKAGIVPGRLETFGLNSGSTVGDALAQADLNASGYEIRVGDTVVNASHALSDGDTVLLVKKIKGN